MSTSVPIVGRVWIDYPQDPALPWHWRIVDANTGKEFDDVTGMQISVEIRERTVVDLRRANMMGSERYELVACPSLAGRVQIPTETTPGVALNVPRGYAAKACAECGGSGYYLSPVTGKRSPCSLGCKHP